MRVARPGRASGTARRSLGRDFGWLWTAYAASAYGTGLGFGAFAIIAIRVLHAGPAQVSILSASGLAVGAVVAVPLGPWVEFRRKQPVMVAMDLIRFAALLSIPVAYAMGWLSFLQLIVVSVIAGAAKNAFRAASGAYLKALVEPEDLLVANARFESTTWSSTAIGPPLGGAAIGLFGPVITVVADAVSYLLSALGIAAIRHTEPAVAKTARGVRAAVICSTAGVTSLSTPSCGRCLSTRSWSTGSSWPPSRCSPSSCSPAWGSPHGSSASRSPRRAWAG
jgi:MFS family permease